MKSGLGLVRDRMFELNYRYFSKAIGNDNELIVDLFRSFREQFTCRAGSEVEKTLIYDYVKIYNDTLNL